MDAEEQRRRDEIDRREKELRERIDEERKERTEADRRIYTKIDEIREQIRKDIESAKRECSKDIEAAKRECGQDLEGLEDKLEDRDREIEKDSRDRDEKHDKEIVELTQIIKNHVDDSKIHKKVYSTETIQGMDGWRPQRETPQQVAAVDQTQAMDTPTDEWAARGVPWWANPKWLVAVGGAIAAIITAVALALSHFDKKNAEKPAPPPPAIEKSNDVEKGDASKD